MAQNTTRTNDHHCSPRVLHADLDRWAEGVHDVKVDAGPGEDYMPDECMEVRTIDVLACMLRGVEDRTTLVCAEAKGDSMVGAHIYSGDYVVFSRGMVSGEGIYVISFGGDVLVKRIAFDPVGETVTIISANPDYPPRTVDNSAVRLLGKVVGWIHAEPA